MGLYCRECQGGIQNPFYVLQLVIRGDKKMAFSELEYAICRFHIERIKPHLTETAGLKPIGYSVHQATGNMGGPSNSQVIDIAHREERYLFISQEIARNALSNTIPYLLKDPRFVEQGAEKRPAEWAQKIFEFLRAEQSKNPESAL